MISNVHIIQVWNENNQNFRLGLAHRTSEKQRPGPLDLALLFQEVTRVKKLSKPSSSMRDLLMSSIQEYNRLQTNKSWRVTESDRKLVYNVIRCPVLLHALKEVADFSAWQHSCFTLENLDSDFYVPGTVLAPCNTNQLWKDLKVGHWNFNLLIFVDWNLFFVNSPWAPADCFRGERDLVDTTRFGGASKESAQGLHCQAKGRCCDEKHSRLSFFVIIFCCWFAEWHVAWQKLAQRDLPAMIELMEICCLWNGIRSKLACTFGTEKMDELAAMFSSGYLACKVLEKSWATFNKIKVCKTFENKVFFWPVSFSNQSSNKWW